MLCSRSEQVTTRGGVDDAAVDYSRFRPPAVGPVGSLPHAPPFRSFIEQLQRAP